MRIAHVITRLVAGGAQRNTLLCAEAQAAEGHQVTVLSGVEVGSEGSLLDEARRANYTLVEIPALVREVSPLKDLQALFQLASWLRANRPHILHTHTSKAGILGRLAALMVPRPAVIHTPHGHVFHSYFSSLKAKLFKSLEQAFAPFTDATIMLSSGELQDHILESVGSPSRMYIVPSGVCLEGFKQRSLAAHSSRPVVGYVGRLADIKGPLDLIDAMKHVVEKCGDVELLVVGDGPIRSQVEDRIAGLGLGPKVRLVGWQVDPGSYFAEMDLLVVPSHNEGMGRVVVEAMACGLPVVATAVGGLVDLVLPGLTGELVPPRQPEQLGQAILRVLAQEDRGRKMGAKGMKRASDFTDRVMFYRLAAVYEKVLRSQGVVAREVVRN